MTVRAAVFASGRGSNFQVLAEYGRRPSTAWDVALLVTDRPDAPVLARARELSVPAEVLPPGDDPDTYPDRLLSRLEAASVDMVLLAGYLRLVPVELVRRYRGRMINLHPALLPAFGGKGMYGGRVHEAILAAGSRVSGVTIHLVDEAYDRGRILAQWPVPVLPDDTPQTLANRIHAVEHRLYPAVADELARAIAAGEAPRVGPSSEGHFHFSSTTPAFPVPGASAVPESGEGERSASDRGARP